MSNYYNRQWRLPNNENKDKQSNYSMDFNNVLGIETSLDVNEFSQITFSFWFKTSAQQNSKYIISMPDGTAANGVEATFTNTAVRYRLTGQTTDTSIDATFTYYDNNWHHIVCTYDGTTQKIYVDGSLSNSGSANNGTLKTNYNKLYIGSFNWVYGLGPDVTLDGVAIFDYALSSSQITTLYGSSSTGIGNPMTLNPVAYYPLGDQDSFNGAEYLVPNSSLKDYVFDFSSDLIDSNFSLTTGQTQFSASIWVKFTGSLGSDESLIANESSYAGDGFAIFKNTSNQIVFKCESQSAVGTTTVALNKWYLATATYNAGAMVLYVNGQQEATQTTATSITQPSTPKTRLGKYITGNVIPFTGELSNAQIFNTALSSTDVETLYNNGSPLTSMTGFSSLVSWYKLNASDTYDSSNTEWQISNNVLSDKAYSFNGTNNIEITQNSSIQTSNFSIGLWIKGYPQLDKTIIENGGANGFSIKTKHNNATKVLIRTGGVDGLELTGALNGEWNFIWFTMSGNISRGGVNGGYNNAGGAARNYDSSKGLFIGSKSDSTSGFTGEIAQVVYYDARGDNYATGTYGIVPTNPPASASSTANLVSWWKLDSASITDSQGSNNGTNNGATLIDTNVGRPAGIGGISSGMTQANLVQSDLSFTSGYSPYALDFDATDNYIDCGTSGNVWDGTTSLSVSLWVNLNSTGTFQYLFDSNTLGNASIGFGIQLQSNGNFAYCVKDDTNLALSYYVNDIGFTYNNWHHIVLVYDRANSNYYYYNNGTQYTITPTVSSHSHTAFADLYIGRPSYSNNYYADGSISNCSIWNSALTSTQVTEIYSEGIPQNLNNHSAASSLVSWWQLGSNSSFNTNWTVLNEISTGPNGTSSGMTEADIVDGVGSYANGTSSGMGGDEVVGDAPYSSSNSLSVNMDVEDRVEDTPS